MASFGDCLQAIVEINIERQVPRIKHCFTSPVSWQLCPQRHSPSELADSDPAKS